jgi:hypothetical protein
MTSSLSRRIGVGGLCLALRMAHARGDERLAVDEPEVGGEDEVRQDGVRRERLDLRACFAKGLDERVPLALCPRAIDLHGDVHPGVDGVGDVEMGRRTHEVAPAPGEVLGHGVRWWRLGVSAPRGRCCALVEDSCVFGFSTFDFSVLNIFCFGN